MKPPGSARLCAAKALGFPGIYEVIRGDRAVSADTAVSLGEAFRPAPAHFWLNFKNDYDFRLAEGSGIGSKIKLRKAAYSGELTGTRYSVQPGTAGPTSGSREQRCPARGDIRHQRVGGAASISRRFFLRSMPQR
jgi:plasmid maintenance system antidote protein VapI